MASPEEVLKNILVRERKARKAAEKIIEEKSLELYLANQALVKVNDDLKLSKEKAEAATKAKSQFLSNMSHEIRTPLNAILGMINLIIEDSEDELAKTHASTIKYSADNLLKLINEILDFSKIEAGKLSFEKIDFCLTRVVDGIKKTFQNCVTNKQLNFIVDIAPGTPLKLTGDPGKLNQILINLLGNACKFTQKGSIKLSIEPIEHKAQQCVLLFKVTDTGIGIPKAKQAQIFESFTQANNSTTRKYGGTGLGLSITKNLIELQHGSIAIESKAKIGTSFSVKMPFSLSQKPKKKKKETKPNYDYEILKKIKVLLVEDIAVNRVFMGHVFNRKKIPFEFAVNGKEAIKKLSSQKFDIVFMDLHMPIMDGREATRIIRDLDSPVLDHHLPVIALSADAFEETQIEVKQIGMDGFISKPVDIQVIYDTLMELFDHR